MITRPMRVRPSPTSVAIAISLCILATSILGVLVQGGLVTFVRSRTHAYIPVQGIYRGVGGDAGGSLVLKFDYFDPTVWGTGLDMHEIIVETDHPGPVKLPVQGKTIVLECRYQADPAWRASCILPP